MVYEFKPLQIVQNESLRACTYIGKCRTFWLKDKAPHVLPFATRLPKQRDEKKYKKQVSKFIRVVLQLLQLLQMS